MKGAKTVQSHEIFYKQKPSLKPKQLHKKLKLLLFHFVRIGWRPSERRGHQPHWLLHACRENRTPTAGRTRQFWFRQL